MNLTFLVFFFFVLYTNDSCYKIFEHVSEWSLVWRKRSYEHFEACLIIDFDKISSICSYHTCISNGIPCVIICVAHVNYIRNQK